MAQEGVMANGRMRFEGPARIASGRFLGRMRVRAV